MRATYETMRERGVDVELCDADRIRELEPRLNLDDLAIGSYEPAGGHAQPLFVADGFVRAAERDGATLRLGTRVTALRPDGQGWSLWLGDGTRASAEVVIVACGPWANKLTRGLGGVVPLALSRGQAGRFRPRHAFGPPGPIISDHAQELWIKPEGNDGHYLIGGRGGRLDRSPHQRQTGQAGADDSTLETFAGELAHRFPGMAGGVWRGSWSSFYDFTPDGNPVIDSDPRPPSLITATGMSGHCFKLAPSLGLGVAELVVDGVVRSFDWSVFELRALRAPRRPRGRRARARMIGGVLLAAGAGSRFRAAGGGIKVLAPVAGRPLVEWALAALAAAPLGDRVIVLGAHGDDVLAAIDLQGARPVRNEQWERGMASSLRAGLAALDPACTRGARRARRRPGALGRGDPPRGRGSRWRRRPRERPLRRSQRPPRRDPARTLGPAARRGRAGRTGTRAAGGARRLQ